RQPGARPPWPTHGDWRGDPFVQPRVHQHRYEYSLNARGGHPPAPPELWWVLGDLLADRHRPFAQRPHLSEVLLIMSERNFSRRRRGGMRFRPSGGFNQKPDRSATEARAEATGEKKPEGLFER